MPSDLLAPEIVAMARKPFNPRDWLTRLLCDQHLVVCTVFGVIFVLMPPEGIPGFELCAAQRFAGIPCPGCGMTRCGSNLVRGRVARAFDYHPLGIVLVPAVFVLGLVGVLPRRWRDRFRGALLPWAGVLRKLYWLLIVGLVGFGLLRALGVFLKWMEFPGHWL